MKQPALRRLAALDRRVFAALLGAALAFVAFEAWLLVLRAPVAELRALQAVRAAAHASVAPASLAAEVERLSQDISRQEQRLREAGAAVRDDDDTVLSLIGALGGLGARHGVSLGVVRPGGRAAIDGFEAASYEVEAHGSYLALSDWLRESTPAIAPLVPTELSLAVADETRRLTLKMKVTAYAPRAGASGGT